MDKKLLQQLVASGAEVEDMGAKATDVEVLASALQNQGVELMKVMERLADLSPEAPIVNVDVQERELPINPVTVRVPSRPILKSLHCSITGRDVEGNMTSFEVTPIYEKTH
jgi:hypothetical protein